VIDGRPVGSITVLGAFQRFLDGEAILEAIAELGRGHLAQVVVSAHNVTHRDIGAKLMFGLWNYTDSGLLDRAHARLFDHSMLLAELEKAGLRVVDRYDVVKPVSEQHFPEGHPALAAGATLNGLLFDAARQANPYSDTYQFVWLCAPSREVQRETLAHPREQSRPLLSAIVRTQGRRLHTLVELLTCLSGQSDVDFETVIVGHKLDAPSVEAVKRVIDDTPEWLRQKIRFLLADDGGRARPLNLGFAAARGRYICIIDDDDVPMANWVEEFRKLDVLHPGRILRCACVRQDSRNVSVDKRAGLRAEGRLERIYPSEYPFAEQFVENASPTTTLAFPRGAFHDLGLRFDETLGTLEDWDFLLRSSACCGVASSPEITGVFRWWLAAENSKALHSEREWQVNDEKVLRKQDQTYFIVPKGETEHIRRFVRDNKRYKTIYENAKHELEIYKSKIETYKSKIETYKSEIENYKSELNDKDLFVSLDSIESAILLSKRVARGASEDLIRPLRNGVRAKCRMLRIKIFLSLMSKRKRRDHRQKLRIYLAFLNHLH
jgi:glycosyltransferase involved in cell wall biosynthesis